MCNNSKWFFYSVLGFLLIGFGLSVFGEAIIKKYENHPDWFYWGTVALVIFNSGICIVIKASSINETKVRTKDDKYAVLFELKGEVPTPFQFITTDINQNFMRAALYFKDPIRGDSLLPVVSYLKRDMLHVLNTLSWDE